VPENRHQGIFVNGSIKKRIVAMFIVIVHHHHSPPSLRHFVTQGLLPFVVVLGCGFSEGWLG